VATKDAVLVTDRAHSGEDDIIRIEDVYGR
jgi:hypothetical protein